MDDVAKQVLTARGLSAPIGFVGERRIRLISKSRF